MKTQNIYAVDLIKVTNNKIPITYKTNVVDNYLFDIVFGKDTYVAIGSNQDETEYYLLSSKDLKTWNKSDLTLVGDDFHNGNVSLIFMGDEGTGLSTRISISFL